ncbi:50S ribosomal protein L29 [Buchnera aphidicola (Schlechtendalia chinensis)]|uniref:Large ribosomal subunit protein uL29 n=1 Tax=Buchnera aphidicola subsp. Schlechtendalia chinensis TaxID=118110 RepID=A0A172WE40_BUCSC|nr:50S ribosomal protein L29 [Buchnera aphidicola]ANF17217.1 50S ribosomal protein L29 [Buchnera aphidicola (Schlechtendalia chinensis)]
MMIIKKKTVEELRVNLIDLLREQFGLRLQFSSKKLQKSHLLRLVRRNIARVKYFLTNKGK